MNEAAQPLDRATAAEYATWFKALADPTRIQIVSLLARRGTPMNVGEIVAAVDVGQSTVSAHLKVLAEVGFVLAEHRGTASYYRINDACVDCFPTAADIVMGRPVAASPPHSRKGVPQWPKTLPPATGMLSSTATPAWPAPPWPVAPRSTATRAPSPTGAAAPPPTPEPTTPRKTALRASLGCGNPLAVAGLQPGETVLDLGSGGGLDVLLSARRVGPAGTAYGLDASTDMLVLARANAARPASPTPPSCTATSRTSRCPASTSTWSSPTASSTCPPTSHASWPKPSGYCGPAGGWASATSSPMRAPNPPGSPRPNSRSAASTAL